MAKKLIDIPAQPAGLLETLGAMAPAEALKGAGPGMGRGENGRPGASGGAARAPGGGDQRAGGSTLGALDVGRYLQAYGVAYTEKPGRRGATLYCLEQCVFHPSHGPNEASIVSAPGEPLRYQCFHPKCEQYTWRDARAKISGDDSLARFCAGYRARRQASRRQRPDGPADKSAATDNAPGETGGGRRDRVSCSLVCTTIVEVDAPRVPPPNEVDKWSFFVPGAKSGTMKFVPRLLADYLGTYLEPIVCTAKQFWRYKAGVWRPFPRSQVAQVAVHCLQDQGNPNRINSAIELLEMLVNQEEEQWPEHDGWVNCRNGMLDLEGLFSGVDLDRLLKPHHHKYGSRTQIAAAFDPDQLPDDFLRVVQDIFPGEKEAGKIQLLQEAFGYAIWPSCRYETAFFLYGSGANGKGTVCDALTAMVGPENVSSLSMRDLQDKFRTHFLQSKLVNYSSENPERESLETEVFKKAVSGELIPAEKKYGELFQFKPYCKFFFSFNTVPVIQDRSYGFSRRVVLLEFKQQFDKARADTSIREEKIYEWRDAVFTWALAGLSRLRGRNYFYEDDTIEDEKAAFMGQLNPVLEFAKQCLEFDPVYWEHSAEIYKKYTSWCGDNGLKALSQIRFNEQLQVNFRQIHKTRDTSTRRHIFKGVHLVSETIGAVPGAPLT